MTTVINLFGGPGCGKSVCGAALYAELKRRRLKCELVQEYVKKWTYLGRERTRYSQIHILGQQVEEETSLYGKVDYVITESPILLAGFYEWYMQKVNWSTNIALSVMDDADVKYQNFFIKRIYPYENYGRYESESEAVDIDKKLTIFLENCGIQYTQIGEDREKEIIKQLC